MSTVIAASTVAGFTKDFFTYFRTGRAPHLFIGVVCTISILFAARSQSEFGKYIYIFLPLSFVFICLIIISMKFNYTEIEKNAEIDPENIKEIDDQFKFSRAVCLSVGILCLSFLFHSKSYLLDKNDTLFWVTYILCIFHISIFLTYILFKNIREDKIDNISVFQIGLFTASTLFAVTYLATITRDGGPLLIDCSQNLKISEREDDSEKFTTKIYSFDCTDQGNGEIAKKKIESHSPSGNLKIDSEFTVNNLSVSKITFWFFIIVLGYLEFFWVKRLKNISIIKLTIQVKDR